MFSMPIDLPKWLEENSHLLKPPIGNHCVYNEGMTVMVVGGPNARSDFHVNPTPELFYQYRGSMLLRTAQHPSASASASSAATPTVASDAAASDAADADDDAAPPPEIRDVPIREGALFLLPAGVPHCPIRFADTVGLVVELPRPAGLQDALRWYCPRCRRRVHDERFVCTDLGTQVKAGVERFAALGEEGRTCEACGAVVGLKAEGVTQP